MKTDDLIADLSGRLTPVQPLQAPHIRMLSWSGVALASIAGGVVALGLRPDIVVRLFQPDFAWTLIIAVVASVVAGTAALVLAVPGAEGAVPLRRLSVAIVAAWLIGVLVGVFRDSGGLANDAHWPVCFLRVMAVALIPATALVVMIRRAAPLYPAWTAMLLAVAATAAGTLAAQLACPIDAASHALTGHFAPVPVFGLLAAVFSHQLLRSR